MLAKFIVKKGTDEYDDVVLFFNKYMCVFKVLFFSVSNTINKTDNENNFS